MNLLQHSGNGGRSLVPAGDAGRLSGPAADISLKDVATIFRRRKWMILLITLAAIGAAAFLSLHMAKTWRGSAQMVLIQRSATQTTRSDYSAPMVETIETQMGMLQSDAMAQRTLAWLNKHRPARGGEAARRWSQVVASTSPEGLQRAITVTNPKDSNLLNVSVEAGSRPQAAVLTNAVCRAFEQWKLEMARQNVQVAVNNLAPQVKRAHDQLQNAEQRELVYEQTNQLVDSASQEKSAIDQLQAREADVADVKQELSSARARLKALRVQLHSTDQALKRGTGIRDDTLVLSLQTQLNQLEMDRAKAAQKYTAEYPGILPQMDAQIKDVKQRLAKAIQGTLDNQKPSLQAQGTLYDSYRDAQVTEAFTNAKLASAVKIRDQIKQQMAGMPQTGIAATRLQRNVDLDATLYTSLQSALNAALLERNKIAGDIQITQNAVVPVLPFRPNVKLNLILGAVIGAFLSTVLALLLEQSDQRVRSVDNVRRLVSGPIIAMLPHLSRAQMRGLTQGKIVPEVEEAFSLARVNLSLILHRMAQAGPPMYKTLLVTSAVAGEGKTMTAAQLARSIALSGRRVILVDANLRRPGLNAQFSTQVQHGLAEVLGGGMVLDEAIVTSGVQGLSVLHAGVSAHSPTALLSQPRMVEVLHELRAKADVVIIDAPDCTSVADTLLLAPHADCLLQVINLERADAAVLVDTTIALEGANRPTAFLVNNIKQSQKRSFQNRLALAAPNLGQMPFHVAPAPPANGHNRTMELKRSELYPVNHHRAAPEPDAETTAIMPRH